MGRKLHNYILNKLQTKIMLILLAVMTVTISVSYFVVNRVLEKEFSSAIKAEVFASGQGLKQQVESLLSYGLPLTDLTGFDELCIDLVKKHNDFSYASVIDLKGTVLFHSMPVHKPAISDVPELMNILADKTEAVVQYIEDHKKVYGFVIPVLDSNGQNVGSVLLGYPVDKITDKVRMLTNYMLLVMIILFFIAICLITAGMSMSITGPLMKLYNATREIRIRGTDAINIIDVASNDEIGRLSESFNLMVSRLKETTVSKAYADNIISSMTDALIVIRPDNTIDTVNEATTGLLGYSAEMLEGQPIDIIFYAGEMPFYGEWLEKLKELGVYRNYETRFKKSTGEEIPVMMCCSVMKSGDSDVESILCTARDITESKKAQKLMYYQANYDMLTGVANRYYLETQLSQIVAGMDRDSQRHTLLYLDLDRFKIVNDVCGHNAGDQLMKHLSLMLLHNIRQEDILARLGGDEFAILLRNTPIEESIPMAERICNVIRDFHFTWQDRLFTIGVSIGAVEINQDNSDTEWILSAADRACYISKEKGGDRIQVYSSDDKDLSERQGEMRLMSSITKALNEDQFFMVYQSVVSVEPDDRVEWYEALIRMPDEKGNVLLPGSFLGAAQRFNLMPSIDRWVIHHFMSTYHENIYPKTNKGNLRFNINISGASLNTDSFLDFICNEMEIYQVPPEVICFEITESTAVSNFVSTNNFIQKLKSIGCRFALDDFGSGLSSFAYLKYLPVDIIKFDGTFIRNIAVNEIDYAMVSAMNEVAHLMGMQTIAEFVESEEIFKCLKAIGIDYCQGFWIGRPEMLDKPYEK